jgi:hypothetical protein
MEGSDEDKIECVIETQDAILDKMSDMEVEAAIRGDRLHEHVEAFKDHTLQEHATALKMQELIDLSTEVHRNQVVLLEERQDSLDFWKDMKEKIATTGVIGALGLLGSALLYAIQQFMLHGPKG